MILEEGIYNILKGNTGVTTLVAGRIFAGIVPQTVTTYPAMCYFSDGIKQFVETLEGGVSLVRQRIVIQTGGRTYGEAARTDEAVIAALHEFSGTVNTSVASPTESISIQRIALDVPAHSYEHDDDLQIHHFLSAFWCHFLEPRLVTIP